MGYSFHDVNIEYMKLQCESVSVFLPDKVNWKSANSLLPFTPGYLLRHQHCKNRGYIHQFHTTKEIPTCIDISSCLSNIILANITVLACKICTYITGHCMDKPKQQKVRLSQSNTRKYIWIPAPINEKCTTNTHTHTHTHTPNYSYLCLDASLGLWYGQKHPTQRATSQPLHFQLLSLRIRLPFTSCFLVQCTHCLVGLALEAVGSSLIGKCGAHST